MGSSYKGYYGWLFTDWFTETNQDLYGQIVKTIGSKFYESMSFRGSNPLISPNQLIQVRVLVNPQIKVLWNIKMA